MFLPLLEILNNNPFYVVFFDALQMALTTFWINARGAEVHY
jgi:hypothetical protein